MCICVCGVQERFAAEIEEVARSDDWQVCAASTCVCVCVCVFSYVRVCVVGQVCSASTCVYMCVWCPLCVRVVMHMIQGD